MPFAAQGISLAIVSSLALTLGQQILAQTYDTNNVSVQTFAGSGFYGYIDGQGTSNMFHNPRAVVADTSNNLFVLDIGNSRIRKIGPDATVSTFASYNSYQQPISMAIDHLNNLWILTGDPAPLLRVDHNGAVTPVGLGSGPVVSNPQGICVDSLNNIYISDVDGDRIYRLPNGANYHEVFVGSGNEGSRDGNGLFTSFYHPAALACDSADNIYVWDSGSRQVRRITPNRDVISVAGASPYFSPPADGTGTNAIFGDVSSMCTDSAGNLYLACGVCIRKINASSNVITMAGNFSYQGYADGPGSTALFMNAFGICLSQGILFISDYSDHRIRSITFNAAPQPVSAGSLALRTYPGITINGIVGRTYEIQSSFNMTSWTTEASFLLTKSPYLWLDESVSQQKKFYRAFIVP